MSTEASPAITPNLAVIPAVSVAEGLSAQEAAERLKKFGPNAIPEQKSHPIRAFLLKFWAPVPWMLEVTFILEMALHKPVESIIIVLLLIGNAVLGFVEEGKAQAALEILRHRLEINARVMRDGKWLPVPARDLVPGDCIYLRMGDMVPADAHLVQGNIEVDQSALTGESAPVELAPGGDVRSGSVVKRGEAAAEVTATGANSMFGKTAELVRGAKTVGHMEQIIFAIVKYLLLMDVTLVVIVLIYAFSMGMAWSVILPFALILLVASVPVALPATFTLAQATASLEMADNHVLVTRLSAIQELASMQQLCCDKTGTLTLNELALEKVQGLNGATESDVLAFAAQTCDAGTQDPIDMAILKKYQANPVASFHWKRSKLIPFDPATKRAEAELEMDGKKARAIKGAPATLVGLCKNSQDILKQADALAAAGNRVMGVAAQTDGKLKMIGLLSLRDPPRPESHDTIAKLQALGIRVRMVTGDGQTTAQAISTQLGIGGRSADRSAIEKGQLDADVFAGVFPEDKIALVRQLQKQHIITGMTGDGVNDAPALKQAEVGIAVSNATDVARSAASLVLTKPGIARLADAVNIGRKVYRRMLTYTTNKITKTIQVALFLSLGLLITGDLVTTPRLVLLLLFANDFVTMSLASDRVTPSPHPDRWNIRVLMWASTIIAISWLFYCFAVFYVGRHFLPLPATQTFVFLALVFSGLATVYLVRETGAFWKSRPGTFLLWATAGDVVVVSAMAIFGILMAPVPALMVVSLLVATMVMMFLLDAVKKPLLGRLAST
ncbi:MAG: plasma-membrane proton-efflux P-type ATPase [Phycisphaerae bacterium]